MAFWAWTWEVINNDGTTTALPGACLQGGSFSSSRQNVNDPVTVTTGQLYGRLPASLPTIEVGMGIGVYCTNGANQLGFQLRVNNYKVNYGITSAQDTWTMDLEDVLAQIARATVTLSFTAGQKTGNAAGDLGNACGVEFLAFTPDITKSTVSAQTFTNENGMTILRQLAQTENGAVQSLGAALYPGLGMTVWQAYFGGRAASPTVTGLFTDGSITAANNATNFRYSQLEFAGIGDNYADSVTVEPVGLAAQTAGTGFRSYTVQTYDETTAQAADNAGYLEAQLSDQTAGPRSISYTWEQQGGYYKTVGDAITIEFRGTSYLSEILGATTTFTPEGTRVTYNLAPYEQVNWFVLDNATFGRLDYNRLSY